MLISEPLARFGHLLPNGTVDLDTQLNTELVHEVITVIHATPDKNVDILVSTLFSEAEEGQPEPGDAKTGGALPGVSGEGGEQGERDKEGEGVIMPRRRYLVLRNILRFCFQHPPLLFPVVQFQRVLRSKIIGETIYVRPLWESCLYSAVAMSLRCSPCLYSAVAMPLQCGSHASTVQSMPLKCGSHASTVR